MHTNYQQNRKYKVYKYDSDSYTKTKFALSAPYKDIYPKNGQNRCKHEYD